MLFESLVVRAAQNGESWEHRSQEILRKIKLWQEILELKRDAKEICEWPNLLIFFGKSKAGNIGLTIFGWKFWATKAGNGCKAGNGIKFIVYTYRSISPGREFWLYISSLGEQKQHAFDHNYGPNVENLAHCYNMIKETLKMSFNQDKPKYDKLPTYRNKLKFSYKID